MSMESRQRALSLISILGFSLHGSMIIPEQRLSPEQSIKKMEVDNEKMPYFLFVKLTVHNHKRELIYYIHELNFLKTCIQLVA